MADVIGRRYFLDLARPDLIVSPNREPPEQLMLEAASAGSSEVRDAYLRVGRPWQWSVTRWSDAQWDDFARQAVHPYLIQVAGSGTAGLTVFRVTPGGDCEVLAFGLVPQWIGRGVGGHALAESLRLAWTMRGPDGEPTRRVWVHTSSADHGNALRNYEARGMTVYWEAEYTRFVDA